MSRYLVLFAREPSREAREKGFRSPDAAQLFASFAAGWSREARRVGATLVVATPPEDRAAWSREFRGDENVLWVSQTGRTFGERLECTARSVFGLRGHAVLVGGDVPPSDGALAGAFEALEEGADAVIAPAEDGGISLVGLCRRDLDLLGAIAPRRRNVFAALRAALEGRRRTVVLLEMVADVDRRRDLRSLLRSKRLEPLLLDLARRCLGDRPIEERLSTLTLNGLDGHASASRAPPRAA